MEKGTHASPARRVWRFATPVVFLMCGALFVVSAQSSEGTDLRPTRYTDLASFVRAESEEANALTERVAELNADIERLSTDLNDEGVDRLNQQIAVLEDPAGLRPVTGPGVTVTLSDASTELIETTTGDVKDLVVHQQDIQAVVNAMWRGGAEAITIQGQRIVSTTGIKCSGNTVTLQGVPYSPPYVITAIGPQGDILRELEMDEYLTYYREDAADPEIAIGWEVQLAEFAAAPPYDGLLSFSYAVPIAE